MTKERWDAAAERFFNMEIPKWESDAFLQFAEPLFHEAPESVLDIGCGAGHYAIAVADRVCSVTGTDLSSEMIAFAQKNKALHQKENIRFQCEDWETVDLDTAGYRKAFDVVIAHRTPAIQSRNGFEKMLDCCRKGGALATFFRRKDPLLEQFLKETGTQRPAADMRWKEQAQFYFDELWKRDLFPEVCYYRSACVMEDSEEAALTALRDRLPEHLAEQFFRQYAENGVLKRTIENIGVAIRWQMLKF